MPADAHGNDRNRDQEPPRLKATEQRDLGRRILDLLEADLAREGYELLDVRVFLGGGRMQVRIYVDLPEGGITLDDVARASRTAGMLLEEADPIPGKYVIEVSSPGIRRPLRTVAHFQAACGQRVDLKVGSGGSTRRVRGVLLGVDQAGLTVEPPVKAGTDDDPAPETVALAEVVEANLDPDFDAQALINADRRQRKDQKRTERKAKAAEKARKRRPRKGSGPAGNDESGG